MHALLNGFADLLVSDSQELGESPSGNSVLADMQPTLTSALPSSDNHHNQTTTPSSNLSAFKKDTRDPAISSISLQTISRNGVLVHANNFPFFASGPYNSKYAPHHAPLQDMQKLMFACGRGRSGLPTPRLLCRKSFLLADGLHHRRPTYRNWTRELRLRLRPGSISKS